MTPITYGLISEPDARFLETLVFTIQKQFYEVRMLEIGVKEGGTCQGVWDYCNCHAIPFQWIGIDIDGSKRMPLPHTKDASYISSLGAGYRFSFVEGPSEDVYVDVNFPCNLLFIDGCHCANHVALDFLNYSSQVMLGGYALFHDTIPQFQGITEPTTYQGHGPKHNDFGIGALAGLKKLGLTDHLRKDWMFHMEQSKDAYGMIAYKKVL